jgi:hypothetical protein
LGLPVIDEYHQDLRKIVQRVANVCMSSEFLTLKRELEAIYGRTRGERPSLSAFQDALYAILAQEETDFGQSQL